MKITLVDKSCNQLTCTKSELHNSLNVCDVLTQNTWFASLLLLLFFFFLLAVQIQKVVLSGF